MRRHMVLAVMSLLVAATLVHGPAAYAEGINGPVVFTRGFQPDPHQPGHAELWTINPNGTGEQRLFGSGIEENTWPAFSPDGRSLAFFRDQSLVVAKADGSESHEVARGGGFIVSWSPDGTRLVYAIGGEQANAIWVMNADGTDPHVIHTGVDASEPSWSPRGDRIVFTERGPAGLNLRSALFSMDVDGGNVRRVNNDPFPTSYSTEQWPTWSPDGSRIAFVRDQFLSPTCDQACWTTSYDIYLVDPDGTDLVQLHEDGAEWFPPAWSPDGTSLVYSRMPATTTGPASVHVRNVTTGAITTLVDDEGVGDAVAWGPVPGSMPQADLSATLSASAISVLPGSPVALTASVHNSGPATAAGAAVEFRPAPGSSVDLAGSPGCVAASGAAFRCAVGDLAPGTTTYVSLRTTTVDAGVAEASALATSTTVDSDTTDNRSAISVAVCTDMGTARSDRLRGTAGRDVLCGGGGDDVLMGRGGDDVLVGGPGSDRLDGGGGADTTSYALSRVKVTVDLSHGRSEGDGGDRLRKVEDVVGSRFADRLAGSRRPNVLDGGDGGDRISPEGGRDRVIGGPGLDLIDYSDARRGVRLDLKKRTGSGDGEVRWRSVEGAIGSRFADVISGSVIGDLLVGGGGADRIEAQGGDDRISGGAGADLLRGGDGNDHMSGGAGLDRCRQEFGRGRATQCERR